MLDEIFELFERDKKKRNGHPAGKRSLLDRVTGAVRDDDRDRYVDRHDRRYDDRPRNDNDDDRVRCADERGRDDDGEDRRRNEDDRYRGSEYRKPSRKRRLADLLEFD
jgi:hypothetical protein